MPIKKFNELINDSNEFINKGKFDSALILYPRIKRAYEKLPDFSKEKAEKLLNDLERQLILLMKFKEVHTLISNKSFSKIPHIFERISYMIDYLKYNCPEKKRIIFYSENKLSYYRDYYKKELLRKIKNPEISIKNIKEKIMKARKINDAKRIAKEKTQKKVKTEVSRPRLKEEITEKDASKLLEENRFDELKDLLKKGF